MQCPLCFFTQNTHIQSVRARNLYMCSACKLVFSPPDFLLEKDEERERYLEHENSIEQPGYVKFLSQAIDEALPYLKSGGAGLDFGAGPGPTLHLLMKQKGFLCDNYDPLFNSFVPQKKYDYIFATECFEHFHNPHKEMAFISELLKKGAILTIMTELYDSETDFASWYYVTDPTHVCFYHADTFSYIASQFGFERLESNNKRVVVFQKNNA